MQHIGNYILIEYLVKNSIKSSQVYFLLDFVSKQLDNQMFVNKLIIDGDFLEYIKPCDNIKTYEYIPKTKQKRKKTSYNFLIITTLTCLIGGCLVGLKYKNII